VQDSSISRRATLLGGSALAASLAIAQNAPARGAGGPRRIGLVGVPELSDMVARIAGATSPLQMAVTQVWDSDSARAASFSKATGIPVATDLENMAKGVDAVLLSPTGGLAGVPAAVSACLRSGIPVWVDGPLAPSMAEATRLIATAEQNRVPLMAGAIEEFFPTTAYIRRKALEIAPLTAAMTVITTAGRNSKVPPGFEAVSLLCALFGTTATKVSRILTRAPQTNYTITLEYRDLKGNRPIHIVAQGLPQTSVQMWARLYGMDLVDREHLQSEDSHENWSQSYLPTLLAFQEMVLKRKAPQSADHLLAKHRLYLSACRSSQDPEGKQFVVASLPDEWKVGA
jgi:hypothetical protein